MTQFWSRRLQLCIDTKMTTTRNTHPWKRVLEQLRGEGYITWKLMMKPIQIGSKVTAFNYLDQTLPESDLTGNTIASKGQKTPLLLNPVRWFSQHMLFPEHGGFCLESCILGYKEILQSPLPVQTKI